MEPTVPLLFRFEGKSASDILYMADLPQALAHCG